MPKTPGNFVQYSKYLLPAGKRSAYMKKVAKDMVFWSVAESKPEMRART